MKWAPRQIWNLHLAIDDASGVVTSAWFYTQETLNGYYHVFEQILTDYSIPYKFLTYKQTVFNYKKKGALSDDKNTYTQFAYACKQLDRQLKSSNVPQAKEHIEQLNQTLQSHLPTKAYIHRRNRHQ